PLPPLLIAAWLSQCDNTNTPACAGHSIPGRKNIMTNSFGTQGTLHVGDRAYTIFRLSTIYQKFPKAERLPFALKILLENLLRTEDGTTVRAEDIEALANWQPKEEPHREISFTPSRVLLQDFTGVPAIVDLAAMRDAMKKMGGEPARINPL